MSDKDINPHDLSANRPGANDLSADQPIANEPTTSGRRKQRMAGAVGLLLAGGVAGVVLAATNSASAADSATPAAATATTAAPGAPAAPADGSTPVREGEKALTGTNLATAKAAALKAVPGGTVDRVETDADGATYEAHMTKADGTRVTVKFDASFKVTAIEDGMGAGGPGGRSGATGGTAPSTSGAAT